MIIVTGTLAWDYIMEFPGKFGDHILPEHINNVNVSFIVNKFAKHRGGTAGNVSYTMGLLRTPHILYSTVGKDFAEYKSAFAKIGIKTQYVVVNKNEYTATGFAMTDFSNNQIWGYYYGAAVHNIKLSLKKITTLSHSTKKDLVLVGPQGAKGSMYFIEQCIRLKIPYMFDPGFILTEVKNTDLTKGITHAKFIIGNAYEMEVMRKRVKNWKKIIAQKILITTLGEKGATIQDKESTYTIAPIKVKKVISTTGAGDSWRGGFLAGLKRNFNLQVCGQMGAVASAYTVEHFGTQEHSFTLRQFTQRYRQAYGSLIKL